jgi:hypothetical protein
MNTTDPQGRPGIPHLPGARALLRHGPQNSITELASSGRSEQRDKETAPDEPDTAHLSAAFDCRLKLEFHESRAASHAGLHQIVEGYFWREGFDLACGDVTDRGAARRSCVQVTALHC